LLLSTFAEQTQILTAAENPDLISFYNDDLPSPANWMQNFTAINSNIVIFSYAIY